MTSTTKPAILALKHQLIGFVSTALAIFIGNSVFQTPSTLLTLLLGTGTLAAFLSWRAKQPIWWVPIHLIFPLAILAASYANIGSWWYLAGFLLCAGLFGTIYQTRVPYYPSKKEIWERMATLTQFQKENLKVIDIGCGMGGCAKHLQQINSSWQVTGIEMALIPLLVCKIRSMGLANQPTWLLGDYKKLDFRNYDILFAYLSPAAMLELETKLSNELRPEAYFISLEFKLPNWEVDEEIPTLAGTLYLYTKP